jgi:NitT/TauT family transport system permease protein
MDVVIADMVSIGIAGFLSDRVLVAAGHRVLHWKQFGAR